MPTDQNVNNGRAVAWVTGAGKGIGRAVALELVRRGWCVCASARTIHDLESLANEAQYFSGEVLPFPLDITDREECVRVFDRISVQAGVPDLAVLNAGTYVRFAASEFTAESFERQIAVNVLGTVNCLEPVMRAMIAARSGRLGIVSSVTAYRGLTLASAYGASKAALTNMCEALRPELERDGVVMSVIHPGFVRTPLTDKNDFPMPFIIEAEAAARCIVDGLESRRFEIAFPKGFVLLLKLARLLPDPVYFWMTRRLIS
jgi:NAD(P)-dependent dehydrogenase (short-subunit alcohol dehydrogenase family)